jgi:hypothetical protein
MAQHLDIVFDGPPTANAGRFVEVEDDKSRSIAIGKWVDRGDGFYVLRITPKELLDFFYGPNATVNADGYRYVPE